MLARGRAASATGWSHGTGHMVRCRPATQWNTVVGFAQVGGRRCFMAHPDRGSCVRLSGDSVWANTYPRCHRYSFRRWTEQLTHHRLRRRCELPNCRCGPRSLAVTVNYCRTGSSIPNAISRGLPVALTSVCPPRLRWILCFRVSAFSLPDRRRRLARRSHWRFGIGAATTRANRAFGSAAGPGRARPRGSFGVDLSRTVGWFASLCPVHLDPGSVDLAEALSGGAALGQVLKQIKKQLRCLPDKGIGYSLLRYFNPATAPIPAFPPLSNRFTYLGQVSASANSTLDPVL